MDYKYQMNKRWVVFMILLIVLAIIVSPLRYVLQLFCPSLNKKVSGFFAKMHKANFEHNVEKINR